MVVRTSCADAATSAVVLGLSVDASRTDDSDITRLVRAPSGSNASALDLFATTAARTGNIKLARMKSACERRLHKEAHLRN